MTFLASLSSFASPLGAASDAASAGFASTHTRPLTAAELEQLLTRLQQPTALIELAVVLGCLGLAWLLIRFLRGKQPDPRSIWFGYHVIDGILFPVLALVLALIARRVLQDTIPLAVFRLAIPVLSSLAVIRLTVKVLGAAFPASSAVKVVERTVSWGAWLATVLWITGVLPIVLDELDEITWKIGASKVSLRNLIEGTLSAVLVMILSLSLSSALESRLLRGATDNLSLRKMAANILRALLLVVGLMLALSAVGIDLTALSVFGGALGVGLGFGLQKIASNYVSGFIILLERSIRIGNVISVGADKGKVAKITTRYTVLRAGNGIESLIPNEALVSGTVQSETYSDTRIRHTLPVQIAYQDNPAQAIDLLESIARNHSAVAATPPPQAFLTLFADSGINLELQYWVENPDTNGQLVRSAISIEIWKAFAEAGISFPYPQREVRLLPTSEYDKNAAKPLFEKG